MLKKIYKKILKKDDASIRKLLRSKRKVPKKNQELISGLQRKLAYQKHREILGQRNSYSRTDTDATLMRMKDDPMRNGQLKAGYTLQIATNSQYILGYDLFPNPTDTRILRPFLTTLKKRFFDLSNYIVADAGMGRRKLSSYSRRF